MLKLTLYKKYFLFKISALKLQRPKQTDKIKGSLKLLLDMSMETTVVTTPGTLLSPRLLDTVLEGDDRSYFTW